MPGPPPSGRQPSKKAPLRITKLFALDPDDVEVPKLPWLDGKSWHPQTTRWWRDVWSSPMASEYTTPDLDGLIRVAMLVNDFWEAETLTHRLAASGEIRLQSALYGLTPIDRSRLRWEIEKGEEAETRRTKRKATEGSARAATSANPLAGLG